MEPNKILSANILDLIFDDRNKAYGAYELRVTYPQRVKKSLLVVFVITATAVTGAALANSFKPEGGREHIIPGIIITEIAPEEKKPILPPEQKKPEPVQTKTEKLTTLLKMVNENVDPLPTQEDFIKAEIGLNIIDGPDDEDIPLNEIDKGKGIVPPKDNDVSAGSFGPVEVDARFEGNWERFLVVNLNSNLPVDNGAPAGIYKVIIQFVVDVEGSVSDIKALTNHGYGMEQEAMRVLKKATKWIPANQNGRPVKAYRIQPITFQVMAE